MGDWSGGLDYLDRLEAGMPERLGETTFKLKRQRAVLSRGANPAYPITDYSRRDKLHIVGLALPAIMLKGTLSDAQAAYAEAKALADPAPTDDDAAHFLAIIVTNLVCDLIEQPYLKGEALAFLKQLADDSRAYWLANGSDGDRGHARHRSKRVEVLIDRPGNYGSGRYPRYDTIDA